MSTLNFNWSKDYVSILKELMQEVIRDQVHVNKVWFKFEVHALHKQEYNWGNTSPNISTVICLCYKWFFFNLITDSFLYFKHYNIPYSFVTELIHGKPTHNGRLKKAMLIVSYIYESVAYFFVLFVKI